MSDAAQRGAKRGRDEDEAQPPPAAALKHPRFNASTAALGVHEPAAALAAARCTEDPAALVALIAATLREEQRDTLENSVRILGVVACRELLVAAVETEADGGLPTADGARRRSPGGVFFELMKQVASREQMKEIFAQRTKAKNARHNQKKRLVLKE